MSDVGLEIVELGERLRTIDTIALAVAGDDKQRAALGRFLDEVTASLTRAADAINVAHFTHLLPQRSLSSGLGG
jgi:hypothetical protein